MQINKYNFYMFFWVQWFYLGKNLYVISVEVIVGL